MNLPIKTYNGGAVVPVGAEVEQGGAEPLAGALRGYDIELIPACTLHKKIHNRRRIFLFTSKMGGMSSIE